MNRSVEGKAATRSAETSGRSDSRRFVGMLGLGLSLFFALGVSARLAGEKIEPTPEFLSGIELRPGLGIDGVFLAPDVSFRGRTIRVADFENGIPRGRGSLDAELELKDVARQISDSLAREVGARAKGTGLRFDRRAGEWSLVGIVVRYVPPRRAADWHGWIGPVRGDGEVVFELKVTDDSGAVVVMIRHRILLASTAVLADRLRDVMRGPVAELFLEAARRPAAKSSMLRSLEQRMDFPKRSAVRTALPSRLPPTDAPQSQESSLRHSGLSSHPSCIA